VLNGSEGFLSVFETKERYSEAVKYMRSGEKIVKPRRGNQEVWFHAIVKEKIVKYTACKLERQCRYKNK